MLRIRKLASAFLPCVVIFGLGSTPAPANADDYVVLTPTGYLFSTLGRSTGQALGNLAVMRSQAAVFERKIEKARTQFSSCHPSCSITVRRELSLALFEKDLYYFERDTMRAANLLFGNGAEAQWWHDRTNRLFSGLRGGDADGEIARACTDQFRAWTAAFMRALPAGAAASLDRSTRLATLKKTRSAFAPYQQCRDRVEINRASKAGMFLD